MLSMQKQRASSLYSFHRPRQAFSTHFHLIIIYIFSKPIYPKINNSKLPFFSQNAIKKEKQEIFEISLNDLFGSTLRHILFTRGNFVAAVHFPS